MFRKMVKERFDILFETYRPVGDWSRDILTSLRSLLPLNNEKLLMVKNYSKYSKNHNI
jgi:hypothetical protein